MAAAAAAAEAEARAGRASAAAAMISTMMTLYADDISRCLDYRCGCLPVPALCHNCTYLSGFDLLALIEFRLESSRAAGVLREEISFLKRGSFAGGKEAGRRASRGSRRPCLLLKEAELAIQFRI